MLQGPGGYYAVAGASVPHAAQAGMSSTRAFFASASSMPGFSMPGLVLLAAYHLSQPGDGVRYVPCDETAAQWRVFVGMDRFTAERGEVAVVLAGYVFAWADNPVVSDQLGEDGQVVAVGFAGGIFVAVGCYDRPAGELPGVWDIMPKCLSSPMCRTAPCSTPFIQAAAPAAWAMCRSTSCQSGVAMLAPPEFCSDNAVFLDELSERLLCQHHPLGAADGPVLAGFGLEPVYGIAVEGQRDVLDQAGLEGCLTFPSSPKSL